MIPKTEKKKIHGEVKYLIFYLKSGVGGNELILRIVLVSSGERNILISISIKIL